jgi:hypothetical protein
MLALYTPFHKVIRELAIEHELPVRNPVPESVHGNIRVKKGGGSSKAIAALIGYAILHPFKSFRMMKLVARMHSGRRKACETGRDSGYRLVNRLILRKCRY